MCGGTLLDLDYINRVIGIHSNGKDSDIFNPRLNRRNHGFQPLLGNFISADRIQGARKMLVGRVFGNPIDQSTTG